MSVLKRLPGSALFVILSLAVCSSAFAQTRAFLKIPGVPGSSTSRGREAWNEIEQHTMDLSAAAVVDKKTVATQCSAAIDAVLGAAGAKAAELVGVPISGDVLIEMESSADRQTFYRATLRGAVIVGYSISQSNTFHSALSIRFSQVMLTIWSQKADGTLDAPQVGMFDCLKP